MNVRPVDPRLIDRESVTVYHVYFWSDGRRRSDEYEVSGATSVREILDWAEEHAKGREVEIAVVVGTHLAYLVGPLDHSVDSEAASG